jgi:hypothetical protein
LNPQFQNSVGTLWKSVAVWTIYMFFVINFVKVTRGALLFQRSRCGHDHMVVGFTTTLAICAYHH